jgi:uroporphyrinogen-III synthase
MSREVRILITRPEPDAEPFARELNALGIEAVCQPLLVTRYLTCDWGALRNAAGVIVTSRNAVRALAQSSHLARAVHLPVFAVGEETEKQARDAGFSDIRTGEGTAEALALRIGREWPQTAPLVHIAGEQRAFPLAEKLGFAGFTVATVIAYSMAPRPAFDDDVIAMFRAGALDGVVLMSPRTADVYADLCARHGINDAASAVPAFCLSAQIAERYRARAPRVPVSIAERPDRASLLELIAKRAGKAPCANHT